MKEPTGIINNVEFGKAWDLFLEATDNFLGNKEKGIPGAHPTYMAALESEAEELDTLYEEVLAARAAVEEAYENMAVNYQAETAAYEALSEDDRLAPYGKTTAAEIHKTIEESYTGYGTEAYNSVCDSEIPAPPQKEDPEPTTPPSGDDTPGTTDKPGTDMPVTPDEPGNSGTSNSPASAPDYYSNSMQSVVQTIAAAENLYLEYTYNGKDYKVLIPAGKAFLIEGIEYYGPLYLYSLFPYDGQDANSNTDALDYTIVKGDTLSKIAKRNNTTVSELLKLNKIKNPNRIRTGQKIVLPAK